MSGVNRPLREIRVKVRGVTVVCESMIDVFAIVDRYGIETRWNPTLSHRGLSEYVRRWNFAELDTTDA